MSGEWRRTTVGEVVEFQRGFDLPVNDRKPGPYPVIASTGPVGTHDKAKVSGPGVVIGRSGSIGGGQFLTDSFWPLNTTLWVKDFKGNDPRFCYYFILKQDFSRFNAGSGVPTLNRNHIHPIPVCIPPLGEQRAIAEILGSLDDKIELNRQTNRVLEEMAQAIFKAWFVDFEPVKAKAEGATSFNGMPQEVFDQLPDRFVDSELGPIPEGWCRTTLESVCAFNYGKALKADNRRGGDVPVYGSNGVVGWHDEALVYGPGVVVGRKGNPGTVNWVDQDFYPIDTTFYIVSDLSLSFLRYALEYLDLSSYGSDSAVPGLSRRMAYGLSILVPDSNLLGAYDDVFTLFHATKSVNTYESRVLAELRDTLLPKLISGELRVGELEAVVEEVV